MVVTVGGQAGALGEPDAIDPQGLFGTRVTLGFENAPLAIPATRGYVLGGALVPELLAGAFVLDDRAVGFVGAGVRLDLKMAQREMGLMRLTARGSAYFAARGMIVGEERTPVLEFGFGQFFARLSSWTRIGYEVDILASRQPTYDGMTELATQAILFQLYIGWAP